MRKTSAVSVAIMAFASMLVAVAGASPVYVVGAPTRPSSSSMIHATAGVFVSYGVVADPITHVVAERLTIWDAVRGGDVIFSVGPAAKIDGMPISCNAKGPPTYSTMLEFMRFQHMCIELPKKLEPGKTWLTLIYWDAPKPRNDLQIRDTYPGTDEIHTLYESPPTQTR